MKPPTLTTERLELRELTLDDLDNVHGIFSDPEAMRYYPKLRDREETRAAILRNIEGWQKNGYGFWAPGNNHLPYTRFFFVFFF